MSDPSSIHYTECEALPGYPFFLEHVRRDSVSRPLLLGLISELLLLFSLLSS